MEIVFDGRWEVVIVKSVKNSLAAFANDHSAEGKFLKWTGRMPDDIASIFPKDTLEKIREKERILLGGESED